MSNCLELTIFSGHREPSSSIGKANYRIANGPIFAGKIAVKSCTIYNTQPNVAANSTTMIFYQTGPENAIGRIEVSIDQGDYKGDELALALETAMNTALTQDNALVAITYDPITRRMQFTFDEIYSYNYEPTNNVQYYITVPKTFQMSWVYSNPNSLFRPFLSTFVGGTFLVEDWLKYCGDVMTADANVQDPGSDIRITANFYNNDPNVRIQTFLSGAFQTQFALPGTNLSRGNPELVSLGMDFLGTNDNYVDVFQSSVPFPFSFTQIVPNPIESVLNFEVDGVIQPNSWTSGPLNLSGDLYLHFRSRILANRGHRTIENSRDTTFFSLPITSAFTQLQYFEPNQRVWIEYPGGIELTGMTIELFNEFDQRVEPTQNYVLELLIQQTEVF
jgi:hypothetical protein